LFFVVVSVLSGRGRPLLALTVLAIVLVASALPPPVELDWKAWRMIWVIALAVIYWASEWVSMAITGIAIILLLVVLDILPFNRAFGYVADKIIALVLAGEMISVALAKHGVDRYLSLKILSFTGERVDRVILGLMLSTAFISMWISNTAAAAIMAPIATGMLALFKAEKGRSNLGKAMMIGVAYAASIGGVGTPVGTPPVPITISNVEKESGVSIGFATWMVWGVPLALILTVVAWAELILMYKPEVRELPGGRRVIEEELRKIGGLVGDRLKALLLFTAVAALWISDPVVSRFVEDWIYVVSLIAIVALAMPGVGVLTWEDVARGVDWGVVFLLAGGLALGGGLKESGLVELIALGVRHYLSGLSPVVVVVVISLISSLLIVVFCSITATSSFAVPLAIAIARGLNINPAVAGVAAGIASCFAFLLPANSPPNAITYSYGYFKNYEMAKSGIVLMLVSTLISVLFSAYVVPAVLGVPLQVP
jgi:sodium-dependent dicarboxylate transporter 2/3/5